MYSTHFPGLPHCCRCSSKSALDVSPAGFLSTVSSFYGVQTKLPQPLVSSALSSLSTYIYPSSTTRRRRISSFRKLSEAHHGGRPGCTRHWWVQGVVYVVLRFLLDQLQTVIVQQHYYTSHMLIDSGLDNRSILQAAPLNTCGCRREVLQLPVATTLAMHISMS